LHVKYCAAAAACCVPKKKSSKNYTSHWKLGLLLAFNWLAMKMNSWRSSSRKDKNFWTERRNVVKNFKHLNNSFWEQITHHKLNLKALKIYSNKLLLKSVLLRWSSGLRWWHLAYWVDQFHMSWVRQVPRRLNCCWSNIK